MKAVRVVLLVALVWALALLLVYLAGPRAARIVDDITLTFLPLVVGLLIAAVGIFLGSLGNLYGLLKAARIDEAAKEEAIAKVGKVVGQVKQNTLFSLFALAGILLLRFLAVIDMPYVQWPLTIPLFSKTVVVESAIVSLCVLVLIGIYDCLAAMFTLHDYYALLIKVDS